MPKKQKQAPAVYRLYDRVERYAGVSEYVLKKNGLRVLHVPLKGQSVVGLMVTYLAGSSHESTGQTGSMHILEHLMFKGSKGFPIKKGDCALNLLKKKGGIVNATTWLDRTNYYEVVPLEQFEFAVRLEADRMRYAHITKGALEAERPAVLSEYAMSMDNDPYGLLEEAVWASAFHSHPYHHPTIGWRHDIEHVSFETIKHCYDTFYHPDNAVVTVVGDVPEQRALETIARYFGVHPRASRLPRQSHGREAPQTGRRFVEICKPGTKDIVTLAFKVPEALHKDTPALVVLRSVLGGGPTSRLHRALVDKKLASSTWVSYMPFRDPSLFMLYALPNTSVSHESLERTMWNVIETLEQDGVSKEELVRAQARMATEMAYARDGHYAILSTLNEAIAVGDWRFFFTLPKMTQKQTAPQLTAVARSHLTKSGVTVGYYRTDGATHHV